MPAGVSVVVPSVGGMLIDCGSCRVRGDACADCVVTFLTIPVRPRDDEAVPSSSASSASSTAPPALVDLDADERRALDVLAGSGLVPPLRLTS